MPDRRVQGFTKETMAALQRYAWPGNVRQLRAAVERARVLGSGALVEADDLPSEVLQVDDGLRGSDFASLPWQEAMDQARDEAARRYLLAVLKRAGKVAAAAQHAGVERESFYRLLRKHGVRPDDGEAEADED
jgi:two-component system response regulator HydG